MRKEAEVQEGVELRLDLTPHMVGTKAATALEIAQAYVDVAEEGEHPILEYATMLELTWGTARARFQVPVDMSLEVLQKKREAVVLALGEAVLDRRQDEFRTAMVADEFEAE